MKKVIITILVLIVLAAAGYFVYVNFLIPKQIPIPSKVAEKVKFPVYMPGWLPEGYEIDKDSFSWQEERVFVFSATDKDRNKLFFTQQEKPKDFDFDKFYTTKVIDPVKLAGTPFPSVYAKSLYGKTYLLSIVTDTSWIMMSTEASIDQAMTQKIAQEIKEY